MKLIWSERALFDLENIRDYIAQDSSIRANHFIEQLLRTTRHLPEYPMSGKITPELNTPDIRELVHQGYRIIYKACPTHIEIITIFNGRRDALNQDLSSH